jgi:hypothetical protein
MPEKSDPPSASASAASSRTRRPACAAREGRQPKTIEGYGALYNSETVIGMWFREVILPGAFADSVKNDDIRVFFNHDPNYILGRSARARPRRRRRQGPALRPRPRRRRAPTSSSRSSGRTSPAAASSSSSRTTPTRSGTTARRRRACCRCARSSARDRLRDRARRVPGVRGHHRQRARGEQGRGGRSSCARRRRGERPRPPATHTEHSGAAGGDPAGPARARARPAGARMMGTQTARLVDRSSTEDRLLGCVAAAGSVTGRRATSCWRRWI